MKLFRASITICEGCIQGEGQECGTPGCSLYGHRVDLPVNVDEAFQIAEVQDKGRGIEQVYPGDYDWESVGWP